MKKSILYILIALLSSLILLEIFFSTVFYFKDEKNPLALSGTVTDYPYTYFTFLPQRRSGVAIVNSDGLYTNYERAKKKGSIRVMLIGGSTARSMFAQDYRSTISYILEDSLRKDFPDRDIEVINAGMSGYVIEQLFIYYQLVLSKYDPDIVVGLNGYNDLMSVKLNKGSGYNCAPQNMAQFTVIRDGKRKNTVIGRISSIFPSLFRAGDFFKRMASRGVSDPGLSVRKINDAACAYAQVLQDIHSFCAAKNVVYIEFLQPIKWYPDSGKNPSNKDLADLYAEYEKRVLATGFGYSLTGIFKGREELFRDDCHFFDRGNQIAADAMLAPIKEVLGQKK